MLQAPNSLTLRPSDSKWLRCCPFQEAGVKGPGTDPPCMPPSTPRHSLPRKCCHEAFPHCLWEAKFFPTCTPLP